MAAENTPLTVAVKVDAKDLEKGMASAMRAAQREVDQLKRRLDSMSSAGPDRVSRSMQNMRHQMEATQRESRALAGAMRFGGAGVGLVAGLATGAAVSEIGKLLDANTKIQNGLKQTGLEGRALTKVYDRLGDVAAENGADFESLVRLYQRLSLAGDTLGASSQEIIAFTERLAQSIRASGIGGEEAASGIQQLTQAMQSGRLQGDELRSILENLPPVAQAIARGMGVSVGALRELGKQGKLTSREVFDAFMAGSTGMAAQADAASLTIAQGFSAIETAAIRLTGRLDELWDASGKVGQVLGVVAEALDNVSKTDVIDPNVSQAFGGIIADLQSLESAIDQMSEHEGGKLLVADFKYLQKVIADGTAVAEDFNGVIQEARQDGSELGEAIAKSLEAAQAKFVSSQAALVVLDKKAEEVTEQFSLLDTILKAVGAQDLAPLIKALQTVAGLLPDMSTWAHDFSTALINLPSTMGGILPEAVTATPSAAKSFLKTKAANKDIAARIDEYDDAYATALAKLFTALPPGATIISGPRSYATQAKLYADYKAGRGGLAAPPGRSHHEQRGNLRPQAADIGGVSPEVLKTAVDSMTELETLKGHAYEIDKMHVQLAGTQAKADDDAAAATQKRADSYADLLENSRKSTEMLTIEQQAIAEGAGIEDSLNYQLQFRTYQQELLNRAQSEGIELTTAERAKIDEAASAHARASVALGQQKEATKNLKEEQERQRAVQEEVVQQMSQLAQSAISGFISDLRQGVSAGEAFNNMLNKIIDSLINMALQAAFDPKSGIFSSLLGGGGGAGGGLFHSGGTVGMSAQHDGRRFSPATWARAPRMATGGFAGLRANEVPAILHKGELVIPKSMQSRVSAGGSVNPVTNNIGDVNVDMSKTGLATGSTESGKLLGRQIQTAVQVVLVRESRPGGILRKQGTA